MLSSANEADSALDLTLATLRSYSLLQYAVADNPSISMHRVLGRVLRHQHTQVQARLTQAENKDGDTVVLPFGLSWCEAMARSVIKEYWKSAELHLLRNVQLLSQMHSLRHALDRHGGSCAGQTPSPERRCSGRLVAFCCSRCAITPRPSRCWRRRWPFLRLSSAALTWNWLRCWAVWASPAINWATMSERDSCRSERCDYRKLIVTSETSGWLLHWPTLAT